MKKLTILLASIALVGLSSCDEYLSEMPDDRTILDSPEKISEILVNAYPGYSYAQFSETMSDNAFDTESIAATTDTNLRSFKWEQVVDDGGDTPAAFWNASYRAIAHANQALEAIKELGDKPTLNPQKGEALMARAYNHFMLLQFFSLAYNPSTADNDLGIPYVTKVENTLNVKYTRQSVKEVMDLIEKDLEEGLQLVTNDYRKKNFHFTKNASKAFAARFYLVKGNFNKVIENSNHIGTQASSLRNYEAWSKLGIYERLANYASSDHETNVLMATQYSTYRRTITKNRFGFPSAKTTSTFLGTNPTGKTWYYSTVSTNQVNDFLPKFDEYFKYTNQTAGIGQPHVNFVLLSNDELYLNRLEALVMENRIPEALTGLDFFLSTRTSGYNSATDMMSLDRIKAFYKLKADEFTPFYSLNVDQKYMLKAILEIKRLDTFHEGLRWLDIKRHNIEVTHAILGETTQVLKKDDLRRAMPLPIHVVSTGIQQNPR